MVNQGLPDTGNMSLFDFNLSIGVFRESVLIFTMDKVKDKAGSLK